MYIFWSCSTRVDLLGLDLVSDLIPMHCYLDLVSNRQSPSLFVYTKSAHGHGIRASNTCLILCLHVASHSSNASITTALASSCEQTVIKLDLSGCSQSGCSRLEGSERLKADRRKRSIDLLRHGRDALPTWDSIAYWERGTKGSGSGF